MLVDVAVRGLGSALLWVAAPVQVAMAAMVSVGANEMATEQTAEGWTIAENLERRLCLAFPPHQGPTTLALAAEPTSERIRFDLSNVAWKSLADGDLRIRATFHSQRGDTTDVWSLDSQAAAGNSGGDPEIYFDILRAKNDSADFVEQFKSAASIAFWREDETVPIASFELKGSKVAVEKLLLCRAKIRVDKNFDPFTQ